MERISLSALRPDPFLDTATLDRGFEPVVEEPIAEARDDDHFYGAWTKGGGRASASARQGAAFGRDRYGRFVQQVGTFPKDTIDGPRGSNIEVVKALDQFPPDATIRMYHGTTLSRAREIMHDNRIEPDDLNSVGLTTAYPDARKYGTYKATPTDPAVTLEVAVKRSELGRSDPGREVGHSWATLGWSGIEQKWPEEDRWLSEETGGSGTNSILVYSIGQWPGVALTGAKVIRHHPASGGAAYYEAGDDDHFYGPWNTGSGGRGGPMSPSQQKAAAAQADRQHDEIAANGPDATGQIIPVRAWREPPPKQGVNKGSGKVGGYSSDDAYGTNTVLGRVGEAKFATLLHGRILHPPGHGEQSPLDVKVDGYGFEVKANSTKATSYKATPKKYEIAQKEAFAKELGVKPAIAIVVLDSTTDTAFMYWRPGLKGGRLSEKTGWNYLGAVQGAEIIEALREEIGLIERSSDDDHPYGAWTKGGGRAAASAKQGASITAKDYDGEIGNRTHITRYETGTMPTTAIAELSGVKGEVVGQHRNKHGAEWEAFKADIKANGIREPIFITVDYGDVPKISEGNHRRDAAVELGLPVVPIEIKYFGHAEKAGSVLERITEARADDDDHFYGAWTKGGGRASASAKAGAAHDPTKRPAGITPAESSAVTSWVTSYDRMHQIQAHPDSAEAKAFESAVKKSPAYDGVILRGIQAPVSLAKAEVDMKGYIGKSLIFKHPVSTSPVKEVGTTYAEPILLRIKPQPGAARDITWKVAEQNEPRFKEAILAPGSYKVVSVKRARYQDSFYDKTRKRDVVLVDLEDVTEGTRVWHSTG